MIKKISKMLSAVVVIDSLRVFSRQVNKSHLLAEHSYLLTWSNKLAILIGTYYFVVVQTTSINIPIVMFLAKFCTILSHLLLAYHHHSYVLCIQFWTASTLPPTTVQHGPSSLELCLCPLPLHLSVRTKKRHTTSTKITKIIWDMRIWSL